MKYKVVVATSFKNDTGVQYDVFHNMRFIRSFTTRDNAEAYIAGINYAESAYYKAKEKADKEYNAAYELYLGGY